MADLTYKVLDDQYGILTEDVAAFTAVTGDDQVSKPGSKVNSIAGVLIRDGYEGDHVQVVTEGRVPVRIKTAASVTRDTKLYVQADGTFTATAGTSPTQKATAIALEAAANDNDIIQARISIIIDK